MVTILSSVLQNMHYNPDCNKDGIAELFSNSLPTSILLYFNGWTALRLRENGEQQQSIEVIGVVDRLP